MNHSIGVYLLVLFILAGLPIIPAGIATFFLEPTVENKIVVIASIPYFFCIELTILMLLDVK